MSTLRFALVTAGLFALAFVGVFWAKAELSFLTPGAADLKPNKTLPTFQHVTKETGREWVPSEAYRADTAHNQLRRELQEASVTFSRSPCNYSVRTKFVDALTKYVTAFHDMAVCQAGVDGCPSSDFARLDRAAAPFKSPSDKATQGEVRTALVAAGGVSPDDFPLAIRRDLFLMFQVSAAEFSQYCKS